jgi:hypothetical protein
MAKHHSVGLSSSAKSKELAELVKVQEDSLAYSRKNARESVKRVIASVKRLNEACAKVQRNAVEDSE